ncbi:nuclear transport factor 2 family protein [Parasphingopyxis marina]|uniref:Nuclear transport factor 2 family protein n=1 Tax=Parasphingopyxis marina TaxID=2761622 RepID=A0A842HXM7_9SPHN|nr:nuclear transport factor 2 family protein [Parasphingopyxis marina]MBC2777091.1 nuclear transport factor 2 family protein [Parasphingopyxis marina]
MSDDRAIEELRAEMQALRKDVTRLKDIHDVRTLHFKYGYYIDMMLYDEAVDLFADDGIVYFLNGIYRGRESVSRVYQQWFRDMFIGDRTHNGPIYGFLLDHFISQDIVDISEDGKTARGRFRCIMQAGSHDTKEKPVRPMPDQCWEGGIHENVYVKEGGVWKIKELNYNMLWQADYDKGWAHDSVHLPPIEKTYPEDPFGPDELFDYTPTFWPHTRVVPFHYPHPVTGEPWTGNEGK